MPEFHLKRIYEDPEPSDGLRVLVDRLWPRGISKERAALDEWNKDLPPSPQLRTWFGHRPERFEEFAHSYRQELADSGAARDFVENHLTCDVVTLLTAAKDPEHNHGLVLQGVLTTLAAERADRQQCGSP